MKISNKALLLKIANYSAIVWSAGVVGVLLIIAIASKFATHDPDFSPGDPENKYLLPMLAFFFVGAFSFGLMTLSGIIYKFIKGEKPNLKAPMGLSIRRVFTFTCVILLLSVAFLFGMRQSIIGNNVSEATGEEVFASINNYRQSKGLKPISLDVKLCDNLIQRYFDLTNPDNKYVGHAGFEKWVKDQGLGNYDLAEIYVVNIQTGGDAVKNWENSPGHKSAMMGSYASGCAYVHKGIAVAILGNKKN